MMVPFGVSAGLTAQDRGVRNTRAETEKRIALVIGNGAYTKTNQLKNPVNDATDMAAALRELGFEVISGVDLDKRKMEDLIREFGNRLRTAGGIGLFYYAGHGLQVKGENYLIPVDADIPAEDEVEYEAVPMGRLLSKMDTARNGLNIVILDACRNNPFARSWSRFRDAGDNGGLAKITPPKGTLVLYATQPGDVAADGEGRNGLFTSALLNQIKKPGVEYDQMTKAVAREVSERSGGAQLPWREGIALNNFDFAGTDGSADPASGEAAFWKTIENSADERDFQSYLARTESGEFAGTFRATAELKLARIKKEKALSRWEGLREKARKLLKYSSVDPYSEGFALVSVVSGYREDPKEGRIYFYKGGLIDENADEVIPPVYDSVSGFSYGLAAVGKDGEMWFIDKTGKVAIPMKYDYAGTFSFGLAAVKKDGKMGFIDTTGKVVIPMKYDDAGTFSSGLAAVRVDGKYGYTDKTGRIVIAPQFDYAGGFNQGLAKIGIGGSWGIIDAGGKFVIEPKFDFVGDFSEGLAVVGTIDRKYGYMDRNGKLVVPMIYDLAYEFRNGLGNVTIGTDYRTWKQGFVDRTGKEVIPVQYGSVAPFTEGLALFRTGEVLTGKYGYIDGKGEIVIPATLDTGGFFKDGLAAIRIPGKKVFGYIDKTGRFVTPQKYDGEWCRTFVKEGILGVTLNGKKGFVDIYGNEFFDF